MTRYIWIPMLLSCMFTASDNRQVPQDTCVGMKEELTSLNTQLQEKTAHANQLNEVAFGLKRDVRVLKMQLDTCSSTASAVTGSYQTQLNNKMKQLLQTFDGDMFQLLQIISLSSDVTVLQRKIKLSANSTQSQITLLQNELQEKINELNKKKQEIEGTHPNTGLIVEIISLQNQIWDLQQEQSTGGETGAQQQKRITDLQIVLDRKIVELRRGGDASSALLELISVHSRTATIQKQISVQIQKSRSDHVDYQKQLRQKTDLLKRMIIRLNQEENNTELTNEILTLQLEVQQLRQLMLNARKITDSQVKALRVVLEKETKKQYILQKQLEESEYVQSQMIIKIINIMKELRELRENEPLQTTSTSKTTTIQTVSLDKKQKDATAEEVKTEFNQKMKELNRTGDATAALILNMINLHNELRTLRVRIAATNDPQRIAELQRQLEVKQEEINSGTANIQRLVTHPETFLSIIKLQKEIMDLQQNPINETTSYQVKKLQARLDGFISEVDDKDNENTKLMLKVVTLQSQVEQLLKQLSEAHGLQITQVNELRDDLATKKKELQEYVNELHEKNQTNARLILTVTDLHNQLRKHEAEQLNDKAIFLLRINELREQLKEKVEEHQRDQDKIQTLESKLNSTELQCSNFEQKIKDVQNDLDDKLKELQSDSITSVALQISMLTLQQEELKRQLENTESTSKIKELQKQLEEKKNELDKKKEELKTRSAQSQRFLEIIRVQTEIEGFAKNAVNDTDYNLIKTLQGQLKQLVDEIQDENSENTKLVFQILIAQEEIARLKRQEESQAEAPLQKIKDLENELEDVRTHIKEKTLALDSSDFRIANMTAHIMELHQKIKPLEDEISHLKQTNNKARAELHRRLNLVTSQLQDSELQLKQADEKTFNLITEVADLQEKLKKTQAEASKAAGKSIIDMEQRAEVQQKERRKLENSNRELEREVRELKKCCKDNNAHCEELEADMQQALLLTEALEQRLRKKTIMVDELTKDLEEETKHFDKLMQNYTNLQTEKTKIEALVQDLQNRQNDVDAKTIQTRKVTLDPNTAHPRISLSADNTEMVTHDEMQNVPHNPGRFDVALAVLGQTGYSSGRHYWEVSVAEKLCYHIGMASESAPRKGIFSFSPSKGFWTVVLNKQGHFRAIDRSPVTLLLPKKPLTLGILLDYTNGQVSFYDAGARAHLYSFQSQKFEDKIYPFINFCVEEADSHNPIVVLTPGSTDWIQ
ncbi:putative leucine-rich repeat-containing protein DDB_G0290503 [Solea solea]|uniref:putative leucine-rich repeat-containing protein DDB_G0290503 n=1 Tax=Solea solea TaxID=90069 RepID=UPI00272A337F|nr:putative leucine-rich repeat-containing protein DDB_G0290503 [Solea solea]